MIETKRLKIKIKPKIKVKALIYNPIARFFTMRSAKCIVRVWRPVFQRELENGLSVLQREWGHVSIQLAYQGSLLEHSDYLSLWGEKDSEPNKKSSKYVSLNVAALRKRALWEEYYYGDRNSMGRDQDVTFIFSINKDTWEIIRNYIRYKKLNQKEYHALNFNCCNPVVLCLDKILETEYGSGLYYQVCRYSNLETSDPSDYMSFLAPIDKALLVRLISSQTIFPKYVSSVCYLMHIRRMFDSVIDINNESQYAHEFMQ